MAKIVGKIVVIETQRPCDDDQSMDMLGVFDTIEEAKSYVTQYIKDNDLPIDEVRDRGDEFRMVGQYGSTTWSFFVS
ncbi:hypothetical protein D3C75_698100 [compost metagenome]